MAEYGALEQCLREGFIDYTMKPTSAMCRKS